jgi:hypothetical protein
MACAYGCDGFSDVDSVCSDCLAASVDEHSRKLGREIEAVKSEIAHRCDGPLTAFVLISRAMELAAKGKDTDLVSNAVYELLQEYGLDTDASEETGS